MHCTNCGTEINDSATFCKNCGFSTGNSPEFNYQNHLSVTTDVQVKKPKRKIILSAIIAAVLIIALGACDLMNISPKDENEAIEAAVNDFIEAIQEQEYPLYWNAVYPEDVAKSLIKRYGKNSPDGGYLNPIAGLESFEIINTSPMDLQETKELEAYLSRKAQRLTNNEFTSIKVSKAYNIEILAHCSDKSWADNRTFSFVAYKTMGEWCCKDN